jgi:hypothetical protein
MIHLTEAGYHAQKRYPAGSSDAKKLKDKLAYAGLGPADEFMAQVNLLAEEKFQLYDHNLKTEANPESFL